MATQKTRHVAVLIETTRSFTRAELSGVKRYIAAHGPWSVYVEMRALDSPPPPWLKNWRGDGIIARSGNQATIDAILASGAPAVELRASKLDHPFPFVGVDNHKVGRIIAEHFFERGYKNFGLCELVTERFFQQRCTNFVDTVESFGFKCQIYRPPRILERPQNWERQQRELAHWVAELPKPAGVMACTDQLGFWLLDACQRADVAVPEELAVVGVENDEVVCSMATPALSSVEINGRAIGYEAAALLSNLMDGKQPEAQEILVEPLGIVVRQSSEIVAIENERVAAALRFIRQHACEGISVNDVASAAHVSRSTLERQMMSTLKRTPKAEILRVKFNRVKELLSETDLPLTAVAHKSGFAHSQYMAEAFKREFGATPGAYRRTTQK